MAFRLLHQVVKMVKLCCNEELVSFSFVTTTSLSGKMVTDPNFYVNLIMFSGQCLFKKRTPFVCQDLTIKTFCMKTEKRKHLMLTILYLDPFYKVFSCLSN